MAILKHHFEKGFTIVPNSIFEDNRLNLRDIGLLCYLLHLPEDWDLSIKGLTAILPNDGRDGISASLKRIEQAGYLRRTQERLKDGTMGDYIWIVSDVPLPKTENPYTDKPNTENPTQIKNVINKEHTEQSTQETINSKEHFAERNTRQRVDSSTSKYLIVDSKGVEREQRITIKWLYQTFGKRITERAMEFVENYIVRYYPRYQHKEHPKVSKASQAIYAFRILRCAVEMNIDIELVCDCIYNAVREEKAYDPMIYLVTMPRPLGNWLLHSDEIFEPDLRCLRYDICDDGTGEESAFDTRDIKTWLAEQARAS